MASIRAVPPGLLTASPPLVKEPSQTSGGLLYRMTVEFGGIGVGGDKDAAKFREYKDLDSGAYLNNFTLMLEKPKSAFHLDAVGGGVAPDRPVLRRGCGPIQHVESARLVQRNAACLHVDLPVAVGRGRQRRAHADRTFAREAPPTRIRPRRTCSWRSRPRRPAISELTRKKSRTRFDLTLPANWKAFASYTRERREGSRPFAAVFGGGGGGGNVEIPESIDYNTQDVLAGLQFANALTSFNLQAAGSFFQNDIDTMTFENPLFITTNTIAGVPATTFTQGQFDLYPGNDYYNLKAEFGQEVPELPQEPDHRPSCRSPVREQNDNLIPSAIEPLTGGTINGVPTADVWNTHRLAQQAVGRCADRHDARRRRHHPESRRERWP